MVLLSTRLPCNDVVVSPRREAKVSEAASAKKAIDGEDDTVEEGDDMPSHGPSVHSLWPDDYRHRLSALDS